MNENRSNLILGAIVGLLVGLGYCYWKQIQTAYQNKDLISSGTNFYDAGATFLSQLKTKI